MSVKYKLIVIRHLKTEDNLANRFCSGDRDVPIISGQKIEENIIQEITNLTGNYLLARTGLSRTKETAEKLKESLCYSGKTLVFPEFRERFGGQLAGMDFYEIQKLFPSLIKPSDLWKIESPQLSLESVKNFLNRIEDGLKRILEIKRDMTLVMHAGSIKGARAVLSTDNKFLQRKILTQETPGNSSHFIFHL